MTETRDVEAVRAANLAFYEAFSSLEIAGMAAVWEQSERSTCAHPGWRALSGWDAIRESWENIFDNTALMHFNITGVKVVIQGDAAWVSCVENVTTLLEGRAVDFAVQTTNVFVRSEEGWRLVNHHGSQLPG
jgi:ketosteroid isomerase-like protein